MKKEIENQRYKTCPKCNKKGYYKTELVYVCACKYCKLIKGEVKF